MTQAYINSETALKLLRINAAKGWCVRSATPASNPRIGSAYRLVDDLQALAIGWASA